MAEVNYLQFQKLRQITNMARLHRQQSPAYPEHRLCERNPGDGAGRPSEDPRLYLSYTPACRETGKIGILTYLFLCPQSHIYYKIILPCT